MFWETVIIFWKVFHRLKSRSNYIKSHTWNDHERLFKLFFSIKSLWKSTENLKSRSCHFLNDFSDDLNDFSDFEKNNKKILEIEKSFKSSEKSFKKITWKTFQILPCLQQRSLRKSKIEKSFMSFFERLFRSLEGLFRFWNKSKKKFRNWKVVQVI